MHPLTCLGVKALSTTPPPLQDTSLPGSGQLGPGTTGNKITPHHLHATQLLTQTVRVSEVFPLPQTAQHKGCIVLLAPQQGSAGTGSAPR